MSYDKHLFHRMAEELQRIAEDESEVDRVDFSVAVDAVAHIAANLNCEPFTSLPLEVAACNEGGMGEVFNELPDVKDALVELVMSDRNYTRICDEQFDICIRRD